MPKSVRHRLVVHIIVFSFLLLISGKLLLNTDSPNLFLYSYGVAVTFVILITFFVALIKFKDPYYDALERGIEVDSSDRHVTCMVAVRNEENVIERCVESLINQTYPNKEVIVVDDASTDATSQLLQPYVNDGRIKLISLKKNVGKKKALGQAMRIARGTIFAFTDSDSVLQHDAVEKIVTILEANPQVGAVSGYCRALNGDKNLLTKIQDSWYEGQYSVRKAFESYYGAVTCVSGPLAVFRKEAIFNYVPAWENDSFLGQEFRFATDRTLTGYVLGSKVIGKKLKEKYKKDFCVKSVDYPTQNWFIVYTKAARAWTVVPDTFQQFLRQQVRWKKSFIRNIFSVGPFYWRRPFLPALFYYAHILFVVTGPFIVARHLFYLPIQGDIWAGVLYLAGILFVGFAFGLAYKLENKSCHKWMYRPLMSLLSTLVLSWLIFYSAATIRKMIWVRA